MRLPKSRCGKESHMKLKPLGNKIILEAVSKEEKTKSGIIIPDTVDKDKPEQGKVLAVGPGKIDDAGKRIPMDVKVGDTVLFSKYSPTEIKIDGKEYLVVSDEDIMAIVEGK
jgi:chaperonin GroES